MDLDKQNLSLIELCNKTKTDLINGLIKTHRPHAAYVNMQLNFEQNTMYPLKSVITAGENSINNHQMRLLFDRIKYNSFLIIQEMINEYGYIVKAVRTELNDGIIFENFENVINFDSKYVEFLIEARTDLSVDLNNVSYEKIYHIAEVKDRDMILEHGIVPGEKTRMSWFTDRMCFETDESKIDRLIELLWIRSPFVMEIDVNDIKHLKFYNLTYCQDIDYNTGIYTYNSILPELIKIRNKCKN